jgi:tetratricopeptide (TPR) repeat protein
LLLAACTLACSEVPASPHADLGNQASDNQAPDNQASGQATPETTNGRAVDVARGQERNVPAETAPTADEIAQLSAKLGSDDPTTRERAQAELRSLGEDALPAIGMRLSALAERIDAPRVVDAVTAFRRVQGVSALDGEVDLERGISAILASDRSRGTREAAELLLLLRALEAQKSPASAEIIVGKLLAIEPKAFRYEARRSLTRLGILALPALVRHQNHGRSFIRELCRETLLALHMETPGRAVQQDDVVLLAALLDAYGEVLMFDAMPVVVSYVADERAAVRDAARRATRRFGKNAIWQLRERYLNATGSEANPRWNAERVLHEITLLHDGPKQRAFAEGLLDAEKALARGAVDEAAVALDRSVSEQPAREIASAASALYGRLGELYFEAGRTTYALVAYRRALRLAADHPSKDAWRARVRFLEAEARRAKGTLDLAGYREALALEPSFSAAERVVDEVSGARAARDKQWRRVAGFSAALLLIFAGLSMLRGTRKSASISEAADDAPVGDEPAPSA